MRLVTFDGGVGEFVDGAVRVLRAGSMIEWLSGSGREPTGVERDLTELTLLAPVPEPPSYRDFLTHQGHYERAMRNLTRQRDGRAAAALVRRRPRSTSATTTRSSGRASPSGRPRRLRAAGLRARAGGGDRRRRRHRRLHAAQRLERA